MPDRDRPATNAVREQYVSGLANLASFTARQQARLRFDSWLAAHDAELTADRDALAAKVADDSLIYATAKASWDRGERDYWDHESDMRPFDPSITDRDNDDCDRGKDWLETVTEIITDFRAVLTEGTE